MPATTIKVAARIGIRRITWPCMGELTKGC
jgi:hypothetical protein